MAEVRTLKCDICGKVYHEDENYKHFMHIEDEFRTREEGSVKHYEHICPDCRKTILEIIERPDLIQKMDDEISEVREECNELINKYSDVSSKRMGALMAIETEIKKLKDKILGWTACKSIWKWEDDAKDVILSYINEIYTEYDNLKVSRNAWRFLAVGFFGLFVIAASAACFL